jgi:hypothetical protein
MPQVTAPVVRNIVVDCHDPVALATFWAAVLGWQIEPVDAATRARLTLERGIDAAIERITLAGSPGEPRLYFQRVDDPTPGKNRLHLDLEVDGAAGADSTLREQVEAQAQAVTRRATREQRDCSQRRGQRLTEHDRRNRGEQCADAGLGDDVVEWIALGERTRDRVVRCPWPRRPRPRQSRSTPMLATRRA